MTRGFESHRELTKQNAAKALQFIRDSGVKLTNIGESDGVRRCCTLSLTQRGPEDIVDGNLKLILGMVSYMTAFQISSIKLIHQIWTLILRFTIAGITSVVSV